MAAKSPEEGSWRCKRSYCKAVNKDGDVKCRKCAALKPKSQRTAPQQSSSLHPPTRADTSLIKVSLPSTTLDKSSDVTPTLTSSDSAYKSASSRVRPKYIAPVVPKPRVGKPPLRNQPPVKDVIQFPDQECRIVLLGKTGNGKSSTGNTILNLTGEGPNDRFVSMIHWGSVTKACQLREGVRFGVRLKVVDTPGFFDTEDDQAIIDTEIARCTGILSNGPHAVLLVIKLGSRFTKEEAQSVEQVRVLFGDGIMRHVVILFTHGSTGSSEVAAEFGRICPDSLKQVMQENRYVVFNNCGSQEEKDGQVRKLLLVIRDLLAATDGKAFINPLLMRSENIVMTGARTIARLLQGKASGVASRDLIRMGLNAEDQLSSQLKSSLVKQKMSDQELQRLLQTTMTQVSKIQTELRAEVEKERVDKERFLNEKMRLEQDIVNLKRERVDDKHDTLTRENDKPKQETELPPKTPDNLGTGQNAPETKSSETYKCNIL